MHPQQRKKKYVEGTTYKGKNPLSLSQFAEFLTLVNFIDDAKVQDYKEMSR